MKIDKLKVRAKKALIQSPCTPELAVLLACWASTDEVMGAPVTGVNSRPRTSAAPTGPSSGSGACRDAMKGLEECMRKGAAARPVRARPTINYHLAKWSKRI